MRKPMAWITKQAAIATAYAVGYVLFRELTIAQWAPIGGFRLLCLLLVPTRYWGALVVGEMIPLGLRSWELQEQFGPVWAFANVVPTIALIMPLVAFFKRNILSTQRNGYNALDTRRLLSCIFLISAITTVELMINFRMAVLPLGAVRPSLDVQFARFFLGNCLGLLTVVPAGITFRHVLHDLNSGRFQATRKPLFRDLTVLMCPVVVALTLGSQISGLLHSLQMLMFIPVILLAWRHGWQGAALAGSIASAAVILMMPERYDITTLQSEVFVALALSTMLIYGSHMSAWRHERRAQEKHLAARRELSIFDQLAGDRRQFKTSRMAGSGEGMFARGNLVDSGRDNARETMEGILRTLAGAGIGTQFRAYSSRNAICSELQRKAEQLTANAMAYLLENHKMQQVALNCRKVNSEQAEWLALRITAVGTSEANRLSDDNLRSLFVQINATAKPLWVLRQVAEYSHGYLRLRVNRDAMRISFLLKMSSDRLEVGPIDLPDISPGVFA